MNGSEDRVFPLSDAQLLERARQSLRGTPHADRPTVVAGRTVGLTTDRTRVVFYQAAIRVGPIGSDHCEASAYLTFDPDGEPIEIVSVGGKG